MKSNKLYRLIAKSALVFGLCSMGLFTLSAVTTPDLNDAGTCLYYPQPQAQSHLEEFPWGTCYHWDNESKSWHYEGLIYLCNYSYPYWDYCQAIWCTVASYCKEIEY
jgi:hypothetical protein